MQATLKPNPLATKQNKTFLRFLLDWAAVITLVLCFVVFTLLKGNRFMSVNNMINILRAMSITTVFGIAATVTMAPDGFDMSACTLASCSAYVFVSMYLWYGLPLWACVAVCILVTLVMYQLTMFLILVCKIPDMLATCALMFVHQGLGQWYIGGGAVSTGMRLPSGASPVRTKLEASFSAIGREPWLIIIMLACVLVAYIFLEYTKHGRFIYAMGGNKQAAKLSGVNVKRIMSIADNIALDMAANGGVRIEIPIPGTNLFGVEVPNKEIQSVSLAEVLLSPEMQAAKSPLAVALGRDIAGRAVICDLAKMPHLLIAGQTGSGKSVCINAIVNSILFRSPPEEVRMIMIDPKVVELQCYNVVPHLLIPVVSDPHKAAGALQWAVAEMLDRYHKMQSKNVRELSAYNAKLGPGEEKLPRIVIIIDELADLMLACKKEVEESIIRIAQLARAAGIHMVVATQRPTVDVITGLIKANVPSRIAFAVSSSIDSRTILDQNGAEKLLGRGDMFYFPTGASAPIRVQGCFLSDAETERVVGYIAQHSHVDFDPNVIEAMESDEGAGSPLADSDEESGADDRLLEAIDMVITDGQASISMLQRRMKIGYARAGRLIDDMAARGIVSKSVGSKPREVLISREEFEKIKDTLV